MHVRPNGHQWFLAFSAQMFTFAGTIAIIIGIITIILFFERVVTSFREEPFISACYVTIIITILSIIAYTVKDKGKGDEDMRIYKRNMNALAKQKIPPNNPRDDEYKYEQFDPDVEEWYRKHVY